MSTSRFSLNRRAIVAILFGGKDWDYFWEARFLPGWLPVLLGLGMGVVTGGLASGEEKVLLIPVAFAIPGIVLFNRNPFLAVATWLLVMPYFLNEATATGRIVYWVFHRGMIPAALAIVLLSDGIGIRRAKKLPSVRMGRAELSMLAFLGLTLLNIFLLSRGTDKAVIEFYDQLLIPMCMYWLIRLAAPDEKRLKQLVWAGFVTLTAQCLIGMAEQFAPQLLPPQWVNQNTLEARTEGSLLNVAVFTSTLLFLSLLLFQYAMDVRSKAIRYLAIAVFALTLFCIFISFSRASWLGCLIVLAGLLFLYPKMVGRLLVIWVVVMIVLGNSLLVEQVAWGYERLTSEESERSAQNRVIANHTSKLMIQARPLTGWGFNNYDIYTASFIEQVGDVPATLGYGVTSHNTYLTIMAELGIIACILYIFPLVWWLILSIKVWRRLPLSGLQGRRTLAVLWLTMAHMLIVTNTMDMIRFFPFGTTIWWIVLGLIANLVHSYVKPDDIGAPRRLRRLLTPWGGKVQ